MTTIEELEVRIAEKQDTVAHLDQWRSELKLALIELEQKLKEAKSKS